MPVRLPAVHCHPGPSRTCWSLILN
jgi:hypothetical protein